jgi:VIT1/CCC1 family predicted Fe2+/Mn2+ transporter
MIGLWSESAQTYLLVLAISTTLLFALPIFLVPLTWARLIRWRIPQDVDLAVYFGRCLGAFILIVEALMLRAALTGEALHTTFEVLAAVALLMVLVHVHGAIKRIQPWTETLEIGFYAGMFVLTLMFWPAP